MDSIKLDENIDCKNEVLLCGEKDYKAELNAAFEKLNELQKKIAEKKIEYLENSLSELESDLNFIIEENSAFKM